MRFSGVTGFNPTGFISIVYRSGVARIKGVTERVAIDLESNVPTETFVAHPDTIG